jgi:hypothetical protein
MEAKFKALGKLAEDGRKPLKSWFGWYGNTLADMFTRIGVGSSGGSMRGVTWRPFKYQYIRRTDGALVPAWGGVIKLHRWQTVAKVGSSGSVTFSARKMTRKEGTILGKKRPSGKRVTPSSWLMRDTGHMFRGMVSSPLALTATHLRVGPKVNYANYQNAMRPFAFIYPPTDEPALQMTFQSWLDEMIASTGVGA